MVFHCVPQVHPEAFKKDPKLSADTDSCSDWQCSVLDLISAGAIAKQKEVLSAMSKDIKCERDSAYDELRALDHSLALAGVPLSTFMHVSDGSYATVPSRKLKKGEKRVFKKYPRPPEYDVPSHVTAAWTRSIIQDTLTGQVRFEVPRWNGERPFLSLNCDEGSKFFSSLWFLFGSLRCRGWWMRDVAHRGWRDFRIAIGECGWTGTIREAQVALNFKFAPYLSNNFFGQLCRGLRDWVEKGSVHNDLFIQLYPSIAADMGQASDPSYGSLEHMVSIFRQIAVDDMFETKGERTAMRSFWKLPKQLGDHLLPAWHSLLLVLLHLGLKMGLYTVDALPIFGKKASGTLAFKDGPVASTSASSTGAAASNSEVLTEDLKQEEARVRCLNTIHFVAMFLADGAKHRISLIVNRVSAPCRATHFTEQQLMTKSDNINGFYSRMARGMYHHHLDKVLESVTDPSLLFELGVGVDCDINVKGNPNPLDHPIVKSKLDHEKTTCHDLWKFAFALYRWRAQSCSHYDQSFPGLFALLVSPKSEDVNLGLEHCRKAWKAISHAEELALDSVVVRRLGVKISFSFFTLSPMRLPTLFPLLYDHAPFQPSSSPTTRPPVFLTFCLQEPARQCDLRGFLECSGAADIPRRMGFCMGATA